MHPSLIEVFSALDRARGDLHAAIESVPAELRDRAPAADRWSVAGVLEHLSLVDERFTAIITNKIGDARHAGLGDEEGVPPLLPPNVEAMLADRSERRTAPEPLHPRGLEWGAAWDRAEAARAAFRRALASADGLALSRVIHAHPRFGALSAYQWGGFIAAHESRHAAQIREIAAQFASSRA
jgi:DinB family protein